MEGYTFELGPRAFEKFSKKMKELERYLGTTYSDICQPAIMTETPATFPDPDMPTITDLGIENPKTYGEMTYPKKIILTRPSAKNLRKRMSTNQTCTGYTI